MIYDRKQLAELLNTSKDNIKKLEKRKTLDKKLQNKGYKLIKVFKVKNKSKKSFIKWSIQNIKKCTKRSQLI